MPALPTDEAYFPPGTLGEGHDFWAPVLAGYLRGMVEPALPERCRDDVTVLRFLWLRTFHAPICIRTEGPAPATLSALRTFGQGGFGGGAIDEHRRRALSAEEWRRLAAVAEDAAVWAPRSGIGGFDGAEWILEFVAGGTYRVARRWCPTSDGADAAFRRAAELMLELAGPHLEVGPRY